MPDSDETSAPEFKSRLKGRGRFLAYVIHHGLSSTRRTPADFLRCFPPTAIMAGLAKKPPLRAKILSATTGLKEPVAARIDQDAAANLLETALDAKQTDAAEIVSVINPDDMVRHLGAPDLWAYVTEGEFWTNTDGMAFEIAKSHLAFILDQAMEDRLIKARDVVDGITFETLAELLPRPELGWMLSTAVGRGRQKKSFSDEDLLKEAPIGVLTEHIPLPLLWGAVVVPRIAEAHELVAPPAEGPATGEQPLMPEPTRAGAAEVTVPAADGADDAGFDFGDEVTDAGAQPDVVVSTPAGDT